ncbi:hypothetical protein HDU93_001193 [Gonapodya sp. JEL0774]|nr:hypothetical protein HDU93_001193 [Gonapodya sp. JEL0774]
MNCWSLLVANCTKEQFPSFTPTATAAPQGVLAGLKPEPPQPVPIVLVGVVGMGKREVEEEDAAKVREAFGCEGGEVWSKDENAIRRVFERGVMLARGRRGWEIPNSVGWVGWENIAEDDVTEVEIAEVETEQSLERFRMSSPPVFVGLHGNSNSATALSSSTDLTPFHPDPSLPPLRAPVISTVPIRAEDRLKELMDERERVRLAEASSARHETRLAKRRASGRFGWYGLRASFLEI